MNLAKYRKNNNLTQEDIANILGIKRTTYASYEQDLSKPDIETLKKISQFFRVSIDELVENDISMFVPTWELSETQKANFYLIQNLSEKFNLIANGYLLRLIDEQRKENA